MDIQKAIEKYVKKDLMLIPHFNISKKRKFNGAQKLNKSVRIIKK